MESIVLLEKRTYLLRILSLFEKKKELTLKEIKQKIPSTSYYRHLIAKLADINSMIPNYFIRPAFLKENGRVVNGLKIHPNLKFEIKDTFVVLKYENKNAVNQAHR